MVLARMVVRRLSLVPARLPEQDFRLKGAPGVGVSQTASSGNLAGTGG